MPWPNTCSASAMTLSHRAEGQILFWILAMKEQGGTISYSKMHITSIHNGIPEYKWHYYQCSALGSLTRKHDLIK